MVAAAAVPLALAAASTAIGVAGTVVSTISSMRQARYQEAVANRNAAIEERNAQAAANIAQIDAQESDLEGLQRIAAVEAEQSAGGLSVNSPSLAGGRAATRELIRNRAQKIRFAGLQQTQAFRDRSQNFAAEADNIGSQVPLIAIGGALSAGSTLIGGASRFPGSSLSGGRSLGSGITPGFRGGR